MSAPGPRAGDPSAGDPGAGDPGAEALAQETRARVFAALRELREPATTAELARHLELHPNGVRRHLQKLHGAGLVRKHRARHGRGRPADSWSAVDREQAPGSDAYGDLARWLAQAIPSRPGTREQVHRAGRQIGRELAPTPASSAGDGGLRDFAAALAELGFQPQVEQRARGGARCSLGNCPYADSARENPELVCTLHRGISVGLLERTDPRARIVGFVSRDPDRAGCTIEIEGPTGA